MCQAILRYQPKSKDQAKGDTGALIFTLRSQREAGHAFSHSFSGVSPQRVGLSEDACMQGKGWRTCHPQKLQRREGWHDLEADS